MQIVKECINGDIPSHCIFQRCSKPPSLSNLNVPWQEYDCLVNTLLFSNSQNPQVVRTTALWLSRDVWIDPDCSRFYLHEGMLVHRTRGMRWGLVQTHTLSYYPGQYQDLDFVFQGAVKGKNGGTLSRTQPPAIRKVRSLFCTTWRRRVLIFSSVGVRRIRGTMADMFCGTVCDGSDGGHERVERVDQGILSTSRLYCHYYSWRRADACAFRAVCPQSMFFIKGYGWIKSGSSLWNSCSMQRVLCFEMPLPTVSPRNWAFWLKSQQQRTLVKEKQGWPEENAKNVKENLERIEMKPISNGLSSHMNSFIFTPHW